MKEPLLSELGRGEAAQRAALAARVTLLPSLSESADLGFQIGDTVCPKSRRGEKSTGSNLRLVNSGDEGTAADLESECGETRENKGTCEDPIIATLTWSASTGCGDTLEHAGTRENPIFVKFPWSWAKSATELGLKLE